MRIECNHSEYIIPEHLAYGLSPMIDWLINHDIDYIPLLNHAGIPVEALTQADYTISSQQEIKFIQAFNQETNQPGLGLEIGSCYRLSKFGILGLATMTSPDIKTCIQVCMENVSLTWTYLKSSLYTKNDVAFFQLDPIRKFADSDDFIIDRDLWVSYQFISDALGKKLPLQRVDFKHSDNGCKADFEAAFECPVVFDSPYNRLCFSEHWLDQSLEHSDPTMAEIYRQQCQKASALMYSESGYANRIRQLISRCGVKDLTLSNIATTMEVTPRTLQRKLVKENISFQQLVDDFRQCKATEYLCETQYTIEDISERLGYSDTAGFSNAFKRWVGVSPKIYRDNL